MHTKQTHGFGSFLFAPIYLFCRHTAFDTPVRDTCPSSAHMTFQSFGDPAPHTSTIPVKSFSVPELESISRTSFTLLHSPEEPSDKQLRLFCERCNHIPTLSEKKLETGKNGYDHAFADKTSWKFTIIML